MNPMTLEEVVQTLANAGLSPEDVLRLIVGIIQAPGDQLQALLQELSGGMQQQGGQPQQPEGMAEPAI